MKAGFYKTRLTVTQEDEIGEVKEALNFAAESFEMHTDYSKLSARGTYSDDFPGVIRPLLNWELIKND
jgi:hypothetical protein